MSPDLAAGKAQRLERAHLQALVVDHARERRHDDHRGDGIGQQREDVGHVRKHLRVVLRAGCAHVRAAVDDQRIGQGVLDSGARGGFVDAVFQADDQLAERQRFHRAGVDEDVAKGARVGDHAVGDDDVFGTDADAPDDKAVFLAAHAHADAVAEGEAMRDGEAFLHQAAAVVRGIEQLALAQQRNVDVHGAVVGGHREGDVLVKGGFKIGARARADGLDAGNLSDFGERSAVRRGRGNPEMRELVLLEVLVERALHHARRAVQRGEGECADGAQQDD